MKTEEFNYILHDLKEENNFRTFYGECYPIIIKYSYYLFGNKKIAKDISQDIFHYLFSHESLPYVRSPRAWLFTLCKNFGYKYLNKEVASDEIVSRQSIADDYSSAELSEILNLLNDEEREIIELHHISGFSLKEIAKLKNKTYAAVLKRHNRIIKELQKQTSKKS